MVSISIIVPVYNASQYLKQCIDSILTQSFKDFELILINDGSTDNSLNICREYEAIDSRVIVIDGPNGGVSSARNKGLDIAKGGWITFVDADDYFLEDALQTFYQHTISTKVSLILGNLLRLKNNSLTMIHNLNDEIISNVLFGIRHIALWGYLIKSDVIQKNKLRFIKGLAYSEDCVFIYQLAGFCSSMAVSTKPVYVHRINETSACSSLNVQNTFNHQMDASYYLGLIDYNQKDYAAASARLEEVLRFSGSKYEGKALALCADMAYNQKEYAKALNLYKRLADRSAVQEERLQAEVGALRSACALGDRAETVTTASALLKQSKLTPEVRSEALYFRAKALLAGGQKKAALADLTELAKDTRNVYGAEAKYLVAQTYFDEGETAKAEKEVLEYIEVSTPHAYWLARSFVLLSDVYVKLDRKMEAKQYLLSLQQNYQADDDIAGMIESRLEKLKSVK